MIDSYDILPCKHGYAAFEAFEQLPKQLYPKESLRHQIGHEPAKKHLHNCYVVMQNGEAAARFALYINPDLTHNGMKTACIGSYECADDLDLSKAVLAMAKRYASAAGAEYLIGPMEGSTWNSYRFSAHNDAPNFFMEPYHHAFYNQQFKNFGFETIANYVSNKNETLEFDAAALAEYEASIQAKGGTFRHLNTANFEEEIRKIGAFSIAAFQHNYLYSPITVDEFAAKYLPLKKYMIAQLIWMIEDKEGAMQAVMFGVQDYFDPTGKTFIIKSLARKKDTPFKGAGAYLIHKVTEAAISLGYTRVIHALMYQDNVSAKMSDKYAGTAYKNYHLYGIKL